MSNDYILKITERMKELGAVKLHAEASGSGDEGFMDCIAAFDAEGNELNQDGELDNLVEYAYELHDYNYSDGDGGRVTLEIDLNVKKAKWTDEAYVTELAADGEEEIDL